MTDITGRLLRECVGLLNAQSRLRHPGRSDAADLSVVHVDRLNERLVSRLFFGNVYRFKKGRWMCPISGTYRAEFTLDEVVLVFILDRGIGFKVRTIMDMLIRGGRPCCLEIPFTTNRRFSLTS